MSGRLTVVGAGYSGMEIAAEAAKAGFTVHGTTRSPAKMETLRRQMQPIFFDGASIGEDLRSVLGDTTHLLQCAPPDAKGDPLIPFLENTSIPMPKLRWIGYLSTVGVYGGHDGAWVDEQSRCRAESERSGRRLQAEKRWMAVAREYGATLAIFRLSGIYGPDRNAFVKLEQSSARRIIKRGQVFNRIHVSDIAGAVTYLMRAESSGIFNVTDDEPCAPQIVIEFAAELMGIEPPPSIPFEEAELSPMARSFYGENKRVSNAKLKRAGYTLRFPTYREAMRAMWETGSWRQVSQ